MKRFLLPITIACMLPAHIASAEGQNKAIPKLQNPFSVEYLEAHLETTKPRLIYSPRIVEQLKGRIQTDPVTGNLYRAVQLEARSILGQPLIKRDQTGLAMLNVSRNFLRRINMLGLTYLVEREPAMLDRIDRELLAICAFKDWNPKVYLDTAEISMGVALALDWTLDNLPASTIAIAKNTLIEKGIYPSWPEHGGNINHAWWINHYNNWNQVCNGGMIAAAITIADQNPELAAKTIRRSINGIPEVLAENYIPDGVCPEGVMYWQYATSYAVLTLSLLETSFGSDFGYTSYPGFMESATYRLMCGNTPSGLAYNYADCRDVLWNEGDLTLAWFASRTGKSMYWNPKPFLKPAGEIKLGYLTGSALAWICQYQERCNQPAPQHWIGTGDTPLAVFTGTGEDRDYYFAAKGGCGAVSHGNMDAGSFIFELNGVRWSVDAGIQDYTIGEQGFDLWHQHQESERWILLTKNNFGHSTLSAENKYHRVNGYVRVSSSSQLGEQPSVTFDMSPAFGEQMKSASRTFTKDGRRSLLITDQLQAQPSTRWVTWQMITLAEVEITPTGATLRQNGKSLELTNLTHPELDFNVIPLDPPPHPLDLRVKGMKRIELKIPLAADSQKPFEVKIRLQSGASH